MSPSRKRAAHNMLPSLRNLKHWFRKEPTCAQRLSTHHNKMLDSLEQTTEEACECKELHDANVAAETEQRGWNSLVHQVWQTTSQTSVVERSSCRMPAPLHSSFWLLLAGRQAHLCGGCDMFQG